MTSWRVFCLTICVNIHRQLVHLLVTAGREVLGLMVIARRSLAGPTTLLVREKILSWWSFTRLLLKIRNRSVTDNSVFKPAKNFMSNAMIFRETPAKGCHWWRTHYGGPGQVWSDQKLTLDSWDFPNTTTPGPLHSIYLGNSRPMAMEIMGNGCTGDLEDSWSQYQSV